MTEVEEFISKSLNGSHDLCELLKPYKSFAAAWTNLQSSGWILDLLNEETLGIFVSSEHDRAKRLNQWACGLEKYVDALSELSYKPAVQHFQQELESGRLSHLEASRRRFSHMLYVARKASHDVLRDELGIHELMQDVSTGDAAAPPSDYDENQIRLTVLRRQANTLRDSLRNPFRYEFQ
jgi:hypothetical protein